LTRYRAKRLGAGWGSFVSKEPDLLEARLK